MVIGLERGADLHMAQLMPLPLTVSCFSKIHIVLTFLVPAHPGSPEQRAVKQLCVCVWWLMAMMMSIAPGNLLESFLLLEILEIYKASWKLPGSV